MAAGGEAGTVLLPAAPIVTFTFRTTHPEEVGLLRFVCTAQLRVTISPGMPTTAMALVSPPGADRKR